MAMHIYFLVDDSNSNTRLSFHELYNNLENIDVLFIGASLCNRGINPLIADDIFRANTFHRIPQLCCQRGCFTERLALKQHWIAKD